MIPVVSLALGIARADWLWLVLVCLAGVAIDYTRISAASAWCIKAGAMQCPTFGVETVLWTIVLNAIAYGAGMAARLAFEKLRKTP